MVHIDNLEEKKIIQLLTISMCSASVIRRIK